MGRSKNGKFHRSRSGTGSEASTSLEGGDGGGDGLTFMNSLCSGEHLSAHQKATVPGISVFVFVLVSVGAVNLSLAPLPSLIR